MSKLRDHQADFPAFAIMQVIICFVVWLVFTGLADEADRIAASTHPSTSDQPRISHEVAYHE